MSGGLRFGVDLDELDATVAEMGRCGQSLDVLLDDVARRVALLHDTWEGAASSAQTVAQAAWEAGYREMRAGLTAMRSAAATAHGSYRDAVSTNLAMWEQLA